MMETPSYFSSTEVASPQRSLTEILQESLPGLLAGNEENDALWNFVQDLSPGDQATSGVLEENWESSTSSTSLVDGRWPSTVDADEVYEVGSYDGAPSTFPTSYSEIFNPDPNHVEIMPINVRRPLTLVDLAQRNIQVARHNATCDQAYPAEKTALATWPGDENVPAALPTYLRTVESIWDSPWTPQPSFDPPNAGIQPPLQPSLITEQAAYPPIKQQAILPPQNNPPQADHSAAAFTPLFAVPILESTHTLESVVPGLFDKWNKIARAMEGESVEPKKTRRKRTRTRKEATVDKSTIAGSSRKGKGKARVAASTSSSVTSEERPWKMRRLDEDL
ncbi:hypothetical protein GALMADRAFT_147286 [Galerina marginata CBS 339.88]|uniref:Uncharacterized protein n=1 Tax=Galerina marginata (strain CBS 339.88) TaxID=685588 RepID=A0A067S8Y5_GALM3|nr:hypothetical protein GALMADRAFT_147286 [Galerina marginata CBS 339.88]